MNYSRRALLLPALLTLHIATECQDSPKAKISPRLADGFDFPVGPPDARGYYDAQPFGENHHLGNDWNGVGGGDTDLGDPVYSVAEGIVSFAEDAGGGWGKVVRVVHRVKERGKIQRVESLYAHLEKILVEPGEAVSRGTRIGMIGTANGQYKAHLHLEIRSAPDLPLGGGYNEDTRGYLDPTAFIQDHRPEGP